jgi:hypothetical protein
MRNWSPRCFMIDSGLPVPARRSFERELGFGLAIFDTGLALLRGRGRIGVDDSKGNHVNKYDQENSKNGRRYLFSWMLYHA